LQAEGGFGSRQFDISCLDSVIEGGIQSTRQCQKQLGLRLNFLKQLSLKQTGVIEF
jgi:hypothetical protein